MERLCLDFFIENNQVSEINVIEEGINSYCNANQTLQICDRYPGINVKLWLYDKRLMMFSDSRLELMDLPKLSCRNEQLKLILNTIFDYNDLGQKNFANCIIYFEQVAEPLPSYLKNAGKIKRILLFNAIKKHAKEEHLYQEKCKIMEYIVKNVLGQHPDMKFLIKLHPRTIVGFPNKFRKFVWETNGNIPWEIYILNNSFENNFWVTTASGAVTNVLYCFEEKFNLKIGLTYKLDSEYEKYFNKNLDGFYQKLVNKNDNIHIYFSYEEIAQ